MTIEWTGEVTKAQAVLMTRVERAEHSWNHWKQMLDAHDYELLAGMREGETSTDGKYCMLCAAYFDVGPNCTDCPLYVVLGTRCNWTDGTVWNDATIALGLWENGNGSYLAAHAAVSVMVERLAEAVQLEKDSAEEAEKAVKAQAQEVEEKAKVETSMAVGEIKRVTWTHAGDSREGTFFWAKLRDENTIKWWLLWDDGRPLLYAAGEKGFSALTGCCSMPLSPSDIASCICGAFIRNRVKDVVLHND